MILSVVVLMVVVVGLGILPALSIDDDLASALMLSGALTLSAAGIGGTIVTALSWPLLVGVVPVVVAMNGVAVWSMRRASAGGRSSVDLSRRRVADAAFVGGALFVPALVSLGYRAIPPIGWDARSIYWFHAAWFQQGGGVVRDGIANPLFRYAHSDYPPGPPALIGSLWKFSGGEDLALARDVTFVLTALAIAGLAWLLMGRRRTPWSMAAGVVFVIGTPLLANRQAAEGYFDLLCAALMVTAVVAARTVPGRSGLLVAGAALMASALTKGEGLMYGAIAVAVLLVVAGRSRIRLLWTSGLAVMPVMVWLAIVQSIDRGARDVRPKQVLKAVLLRPRERSRLRLALPQVLEEVLPYLVLVGLVLALVGGAVLLERSRAPLTTPLSMVVIGLGLVGFLAIYYSGGPYPLDWWFATSLARVTTASKLLFLGAVVHLMLMAVDRSRVGPDAELVTSG